MSRPLPASTPRPPPFAQASEVPLAFAALALFVEQTHPGPHVIAVIVEGASAHEIAVHDARFVDEDPAADFQVKLAFGDGGHAPPRNAAGAGATPVGQLPSVTVAGTIS